MSVRRTPWRGLLGIVAAVMTACTTSATPTPVPSPIPVPTSSPAATPTAPQAPAAAPAPAPAPTTSSATPAAAPAPRPAIQTKTLFEQRVEQLPQLPICWDVRSGSLASGAKSPATGVHTHGWVAAYVNGGAERVTYEGGTSSTVNTGEGILFDANKPHVHESVGTVPRTNIVFELTCTRQAGSVATSGSLPGIRSGAVPYQVQMRERKWPSGAQTPIHVLSGPTTTNVVEGTIGRSTSSVTVRSGPGELYVSPVGDSPEYLGQQHPMPDNRRRYMAIGGNSVGDATSRHHPAQSLADKGDERSKGSLDQVER